MRCQEEYDIDRETGATDVDEVKTKKAYKMNDTIEDNDHLWPNFETACRVISNDLAEIKLYKLFGGCPNTCAGDVFLADAIISAKRILNHLMEAQARRDDFIARHKKSQQERT